MSTGLRLQARLRRYSSYTAIVVGVTGILVLFGWALDIDFLKRIIPGLVAMNPATACCFILLSVAIFGINLQSGRNRKPMGSDILAVIVLIIALTCLLFNVLKIAGGIDQWMFADKLDDRITHQRNRMAPNTSANFIIACISVLLVNRRKEKTYKTSQYLILVTALVSLISIIGYVYGVKSFYGVLSYIPMALNTSFCFLFISIAILLSSSHGGVMSELTNNYVGSVIARRLFPYIIAVPVFLGFVTIYGEQMGLYVAHFGTALFTAANILIFAWLIRKIQTSVNKADEARTTAEKQLAELNRKLEEKTASLEFLNGELESFSYSISHDLKAPLRALGGHTKILYEDFIGALGEDGKVLVDSLLRNVQKMNQLIDDLLEFSRIGRKELNRSRCDMEQLVNNVLKDQQQALTDKRYEIKITELLPCNADPRLITQVWVNLISNALKYSRKKEKPVVEIGSWADQGNNVYFVKDNGAGFDMNFANKLFAVFQRLHTEKDFEGTGIGLAIVSKIITRHGGKVWAEAKPNEGACFYFSLPQSDEV